MENSRRRPEPVYAGLGPRTGSGGLRRDTTTLPAAEKNRGKGGGNRLGNQPFARALPPLNFGFQCSRSNLNFLNVLCRRPALTLFDVKGDPIPFRQCFESGHVDGGMVNKDISAFFPLDKSKPFFVAKPLYHSSCHFVSSS